MLISTLFSTTISAQDTKKDAKYCENFQKIIKSANTSSLGDNKGNSIGSDIFSAKTYLVSTDAKIYFDDVVNNTVYEEQIGTFSDTAQTVSQRNIVLDNTLHKLLSCLPKDNWIVMREGDSVNGNAYEVKNLDLRVFINVGYQQNGIVMKLYRQQQQTAKCLSGDCVNGLGTMQYENGDLYEGQFINSQRIGMGKYIWAADQSRYEGSWLSDTMNGYGTYFNKQGVQEKEGYLMKGNLIEIDTSNKDFCQYGDCKNGFGTYYYSGGQVYMGNFKNGLPQGLGLFESENGIYYGEFLNGKYNGKGIVFGTDGIVFRADFLDGKQIGKVVSTNPGESVKEAIITDSVLVGAEYTPEGILTKIGSWQGDKFIPSTSKDDKNLIEFAQSLAKLYSYRDHYYGRLRGNLRKGKKVVYYDAIFKLKDAAATFVREEFEKEPYVRASLTLQPSSNKQEAIEKYEWAVRNIRKSLNSRWKTDPGKNRDTETAANRNYTFINLDNTKSFIDVRVADNLVYIDIH
ncbi:MAG: hypothetical protein ACXWDO_00525 [Bacteroidia bacterium]